MADHVYRVGIHTYMHVPDGTEARVRVWCGGSATPWTFARTIASYADRTSNDFWRVADVAIDASSACTVTSIDDVITTSISQTTR